MTSGIYSITNTTNGHRYIGSAVNLAARWSVHRHKLGRGTHHSRHLQNAWNKYGELSFAFEILEECEIHQLIEREQWWFDCAQPEYNICPAAGSSLGVKHTKEYCRNDSERQKGKHLTEEHRRKIGDSQRGKPKSAQAGRHISEARKGAVFTDEHRAHLSEAKKGKKLGPQTEEHRRHLSEAHKSRRNSAERLSKQEMNQ